MQKVSTTRMELLAKKAQIALARQGRELLEQRGTALMREFLRVADRVMAGSDALQQSATEARRALARAEAVAGTEAVRSAAMATRGGLPLGGGAEGDSLIQLAESERRLTRLAAEIQRTSRRVNALEHVLIPRLTAERDYIQITLDERERADHFRLKRVKQTHQRKATPDDVRGPGIG